MPSQVRRAFRITTTAAGLRLRIHPHALRHAHATELWREGVDIYTICPSGPAIYPEAGFIGGWTVGALA